MCKTISKVKNKVRIFFILGLVFLFASNCGTRPPSKTSTENRAEFSRLEEDILTKINQHRSHKGLSPLKMNNNITAEAEEHSRQMATGKTSFGHSGFDARIKRISNVLGPARKSAENVALGSKSAEDVVSGWLNSPGHKQNIEGDFTLTGIGVARNEKGVLYYTQLFIKL